MTSLPHYTLFWLRTLNPWRKSLIDARRKSILDIDFEAFKKLGVELAVFDVDDTVTDFEGPMPERTMKFITELQAMGIKVGFFSNCSEERNNELQTFFRQLHVYNVDRSDKPNPAGYQELLDHYDTHASNAMMVGDKLGTDLYGAHLAGFKYKVLVTPYSIVFGGLRANLANRFLRAFEKFFYFIV